MPGKGRRARAAEPTHGKGVILWTLQTASHRIRRAELLKTVPADDYAELLAAGEIREYHQGKKVYVTLSVKGLQWWR